MFSNETIIYVGEVCICSYSAFRCMKYSSFKWKGPSYLVHLTSISCPSKATSEFAIEMTEFTS